jgi:hypothetical protein
MITTASGQYGDSPLLLHSFCMQHRVISCAFVSGEVQEADQGCDDVDGGAAECIRHGRRVVMVVVDDVTCCDAGS